MRLWLVLVLCMLALSCHREGAEVTTLPPGPPAQGRCPDDPRPLVVAIQQVISDERTDDTNLDRVRRPVLFEHLRLMESDELYEGNWYVPLTSFDVQPGDPLPEGVPRSEDPVWVLSGGEPCPMTAGRRLRLQMSLGGPPFEVLVRLLEGDCALTEAPTLGLQQAQSPGSCRYIPMISVEGPDKAPFALSPEAAQALSPDTCKPPGCYIERHFQATALPDGAQVVGINGIRYNLDSPNIPDCDTIHPIDAAWFRLKPEDPWLEWARGDEGRHLLYDDRGLRALVTQAHGFALLYTPTPEPVMAYHTRWAVYNEEEANSGLNPCGP